MSPLTEAASSAYPSVVTLSQSRGARYQVLPQAGPTIQHGRALGFSVPKSLHCAIFTVWDMRPLFNGSVR